MVKGPKVNEHWARQQSTVLDSHKQNHLPIAKWETAFSDTREMASEAWHIWPLDLGRKV